jgi:endonuclease YncB( thermonuclease family)
MSALLGLYLVLLHIVFSADLAYRVTAISDGDGIRVIPLVGQSVEMKVRLSCIDAPELGPFAQAFGKEARDFLAKLLPIGTTVYLPQPLNKDVYGRSLAEVFIQVGSARVNINQELVKASMAFVYCYFVTKQGCSADYYALESHARSQCSGIWSIPPDGLLRPWDFRRLMKNQAPFANSCPNRQSLACFSSNDNQDAEDNGFFEAPASQGAVDPTSFE